MVVHLIKRIQFLDKEVPICLQNENGPCPLLALVNVLLLRGILKLHPDRNEIGTDQLIGMLGNYLLESNPPLEDSEAQENQAKTIDDVIQILPSLQQGLDVNVKFNDIRGFEFDARISVFDLLGVHLFHGWVIDPQETEYMQAVGSLSYNQLLDKLIKTNEIPEEKKSSEDVAAILHEGEVAKEFLENTASQLTYYGLMELHQQTKEHELCAFFRNNHFSTMFKIDGHLYLLVTDQGYKDNNTVAWEQLDEIDGNTSMCSPTFGSPNEYLHPSDYGVHLEGTAPKGQTADELLAMQLQQQENERHSQRNPQQQQQPRQPPQPSQQQQRQQRKEKSDCLVM